MAAAEYGDKKEYSKEGELHGLHIIPFYHEIYGIDRTIQSYGAIESIFLPAQYAHIVQEFLRSF